MGRNIEPQSRPFSVGVPPGPPISSRYRSASPTKCQKAPLLAMLSVSLCQSSTYFHTVPIGHEPARIFLFGRASEILRCVHYNTQRLVCHDIPALCRESKLKRRFPARAPCHYEPNTNPNYSPHAAVDIKPLTRHGFECEPINSHPPHRKTSVARSCAQDLYLFSVQIPAGGGAIQARIELLTRNGAFLGTEHFSDSPDSNQPDMNSSDEPLSFAAKLHEHVGKGTFCAVLATRT